MHTSEFVGGGLEDHIRETPGSYAVVIVRCDDGEDAGWAVAYRPPPEQHADYPHEPGRLYDCPACEASCHCTAGYTQCVYSGEHNGLADDGTERHETADGNPYIQYTPEHRVWAIAQEHGKAAASWVTDGNTPQETYRYFLRGIEDGDPAVMDSIRTPELSGEHGDEYTEDALMADAGWVPHDGTDLRDELASQYNDEVSAAFWHEVERACRKALGEAEGA
jgi:hypothetical protein